MIEAFSCASEAIFDAAGLFVPAGCGAWRATSDGVIDGAKWVFTTQVKTMNIDLDAHAASNETSGGQSLSTNCARLQLTTRSEKRRRYDKKG